MPAALLETTHPPIYCQGNRVRGQAAVGGPRPVSCPASSEFTMHVTERPGYEYPTLLRLGVLKMFEKSPGGFQKARQ